MTVTFYDNSPLQDTTFQPSYEAQNPRAVVSLNGKRYIPHQYVCYFNAHGSTDTATVVLPISNNPDFSIELFRNANDQSPVYAEIYAGFTNTPTPGSTDISQLSLRFTGIADLYNATFDEDHVRFECRSLAAPLVDNKITTLQRGQTSVDFVKEMAAAVGLNTQIQLAAPPVTVQEVLAAEYIGGSNYSAAVFGMHPWDIILQCAQFDDVDAWVDKDTLYYVAPGLLARKTIDLQWGRDFKSLSPQHSIQYSRNVQVEARSYQERVRASSLTRVTTNPFGGVSVQHSTRRVTSAPIFGTNEQVSTSIDATGATTTNATSYSGGKSSSGFTKLGTESGKERYIYWLKNASPAMCNAYAQTKWREISMHEFQADFEIPVTKALLDVFDITALLHIHGTPYVLVDDTYWPRQITEMFGMDEGWHWSSSAVNHQLPQGAV